jgi:dinuclear metal center YbgI/SA1388 family protein
MNTRNVLSVLEAMAPLRWAASWDNVGLLVGDPMAEIERVLVTVDYGAEVAEEAYAFEAQLVVAYHPPMFEAVKRVPHDALWAEAIRRGIAIYSPHTALDVGPSGTNDVLADSCGISPIGRRPLRLVQGLEKDPSGIGFGRVGDVAPQALEAFLATVKAELGVDHALVAAASSSRVRRVAVAAGAGGELLADALREGADAFVTGEVRHHDALRAVRAGMSVIALLHSNSERKAVRAFASQLGQRLSPHITVRASTRDADPFTFC